MKNTIDALAFDLDGTLYPNYRLNIRLIPFIMKEYKLLLAMGKARNALRADAPGTGEEFYRRQARLMGEILREDPEITGKRTERLIYRGWEPLFKGISPFRAVRQTLEKLQAAGFKLGILSDFPPENKLPNLGLAGLWDTVLCSETTGRLKPDPVPFLELAEKMGLKPERILYVGNSVPYDIVGAKKAGMRAALISFPFKKRGGQTGNADFVFSHYRQLAAYMLQ
jgi:putative hydrolase of the HAD superfamily